MVSYWVEHSLLLVRVGMAGILGEYIYTAGTVLIVLNVPLIIPSQESYCGEFICVFPYRAIVRLGKIYLQYYNAKDVGEEQAELRDGVKQVIRLESLHFYKCLSPTPLQFCGFSFITNLILTVDLIVLYRHEQ